MINAFQFTTSDYWELFIIDHFKVYSYFKGDSFPSNSLSEDYWDWSRVLCLGRHITHISSPTSQGNIPNCYLDISKQELKSIVSSQ